jgi:hypothetical protein
MSHKNSEWVFIFLGDTLGIWAILNKQGGNVWSLFSSRYCEYDIVFMKQKFHNYDFKIGNLLIYIFKN